MRIALVVRRLAGLRGGAERVVCELAGSLASRGHAVTVVTYEAAQGDPAFGIGDARVIDLFPAVLRSASGRGAGSDAIEAAVRDRSAGRIVDRARWELSHGWFARRLAAWLRANPQDAVVGFLPPAISAVGLAAERLDRRPRVVVASTHSLPSLDFGPGGRWDPSPRARALNVHALESVDVVTVLRPDFVQQLPPAARENAVVIPNGVSAPRTAQRRPDDVVLGVGRFVSTKRFDLLIEAFAAAAPMLDGWRLRLCGDGPDRSRLEALVCELGVDDRVELPGAVDDMTAEYRRAAMVVHPSEFEGFGLVVVEAVLHGVPVVASSACTGLETLIADGVTGRMVDESGDAVAAFAEAITALADDPLPADAFETASRDLAARFDPDVIVDRWEALLRGVAAAD